MRARTILATVAGTLAVAELATILERRHEELLDRLDELTTRRERSTHGPLNGASGGSALNGGAGGTSAVVAQGGGGGARVDVAAGQTVSVTIPASTPVAAVLYGPGTGKVAVITTDGGIVIHAAPYRKWEAVAAIARTIRSADGPDVDELERKMLEQHHGAVKHVKDLPPKTLQRATTRLLDAITTTPNGGAR